MRVALYARVSTRDKDQNSENQLVLLRREAEHAGDTMIKEYVDEESGGKASRKQFQQMMRDAEKRRFDLVRVLALDRFSSQGIEALFEYTAELDQCGVAFWIYCEPMLNTTGPMAALYKAIIAWATGYRNQRPSENVRLGRARKRAQVEATGEQYQHGRRPLGDDMAVRVHELASQGLNRQKIVEAVGVSLGTVQKYLK
jgi:DNA invertase Pin-like site-specific DNA recombinase